MISEVTLLNMYNSHSLTRIVCIGICFVGLALIFVCNDKVQRVTNTEITDVAVQSEDGAIDIRWNPPSLAVCDTVSVVISDGENVVYEKEMWPVRRHLSYSDGEHGRLYTISVTARYKDGTLGGTNEKRALFLDYSKLPDLPLIVMSTVNGENPTYEEAEKPEEDLWGQTIINNESVIGKMVMYGNGIGRERTLSTGMKIRVRGNSSAVFTPNKSFRISLDDSYPLLGNTDISCKEWVLLNTGMKLKTYVGDYVGELCGMEWQPRMMFVNVILNGDWQGCYNLTPAVNIDAAGDKVSGSGYIFENDAYWWNSDGLYFKTEHQIKQMGYTFKYPDITSPEDETVLRLKNYMQEFENCILNGDEKYREYIDEESFAKWILVQDILGNTDGGGSNMYFYKYDYDENNPTSSKVKMGPLWDFDATLAQDGAWSNPRGNYISYFPYLFEQGTFYSEYLSGWLSVMPRLSDSIDEMLNQLEAESGDALDESWELNCARWNRAVVPFATQKEAISRWFKDRVEWMNHELNINPADIAANDSQ